MNPRAQRFELFTPDSLYYKTTTQKETGVKRGCLPQSVEQLMNNPDVTLREPRPSWQPILTIDSGSSVDRALKGPGALSAHLKRPFQHFFFLMGKKWRVEFVLLQKALGRCSGSCTRCSLSTQTGILEPRHKSIFRSKVLYYMYACSVFLK